MPRKPADTQSHPKVKMFRWYKNKIQAEKAEAVPSAYMNKLSELTIRYPGVRDQGNMIRAGHFPQSDLRSLI